MPLEVKRFGDPILKSRAARVKDFDESLSRLAQDMLETMRAHEGVGLAGNQVGRLKRILVAEVEDETYIVVNPVIEDGAAEAEKDMEGCLSIPGVHVEVERSPGITVTGQDLSGEPVRVEATGLLARIFQHEVDHLDGILILDRTDRDSRKAAMREWRERLLVQS